MYKLISINEIKDDELRNGTTRIKVHREHLNMMPAVGIYDNITSALKHANGKESCTSNYRLHDQETTIKPYTCMVASLVSLISFSKNI